MRILLTGRNGQTGSELAHLLPGLGDVIATDRAALDLASPSSIQEVVRREKPGLIVNAAAYNAVDKAESERDLAMAVNGVAPGILAEEARRLGALLVHYSTDYVFGGGKRAPHVEADAPRPLSYYGETKLAGERAVLASGCRHLVLRTSWVYGPRAANFYQLIRRKAEAGEPMRMVDDQTSVPTTSAFLASHTALLLKSGAEGLLHLVPSGQATRYEFALAVVKAMGSRSKVEPAKTSDFPTAAQRPAYSVLCNAKAAGILGQPIPDWNKIGPLRGGLT